jgi:hypothetical protein
MSDRLMAVLAYAILVAFLGVLVIYVPRVDLTIAITITVLLAGWDFFFAKS